MPHMDSTAIMQISGAVVVLCQLAKSVGVTGRFALITSSILSALGCGIWGWANGAFSRATTWDLFSGFVVVLSAAAGVFNLINSAPESVATITGGVKGAASALRTALGGTSPNQP